MALTRIARQVQDKLVTQRFQSESPVIFCRCCSPLYVFSYLMKYLCVTCQTFLPYRYRIYPTTSSLFRFNHYLPIFHHNHSLRRSYRYRTPYVWSFLNFMSAHVWANERLSISYQPELDNVCDPCSFLCPAVKAPIKLLDDVELTSSWDLYL